MRACFNCCGSVMLAIVSGSKSQSFIVREKNFFFKQFLLVRMVLKALLFR